MNHLNDNYVVNYNVQNCIALDGEMESVANGT